MSKRILRYSVPPKKVFRAMGLGLAQDGRIKVIAGFTFKWWDPESATVPLFVSARIIRLKTGGQPCAS